MKKYKEKYNDFFFTILIIGLLILVTSLFKSNVIKDDNRIQSERLRIFVKSDEKQEGLPELIMYILDNMKK
jgi:hypothetical protein